jgi:TetR/AcrR family transcriptional regulator, regulator of autoinduction and epiphytic fitness
MSVAIGDETYHQRVREEKRQAAVQAAAELFLEQGYERTSLQQVARRADLSTATLFKRYPSKAALFEAIVETFWAVEKNCGAAVPTGDPRACLRKIGLDYAKRMRGPQMAAIYRLIISEATRFPDLGQMLFDKGKGPYLEWLCGYLTAEVKAGELVVPDIPNTARAFLAIIAGQVFWPELMVQGCGGSDAEVEAVVDQAITMVLATCAKPSLSESPARGSEGRSMVKPQSTYRGRGR